MSLREQPHYDTAQPVAVTVLGDAPAAHSGEVAGFCGTAMRLMLEVPVPQGAAVKVEWEDTLLLGEVSDCQPDGSQYAINLKLEHSLVHTAELARLAARILEEDGQRLPRRRARGPRRAASRINPPAKS